MSDARTLEDRRLAALVNLKLELSGIASVADVTVEKLIAWERLVTEALR